MSFLGLRIYSTLSPPRKRETTLSFSLSLVVGGDFPPSFVTSYAEKIRFSTIGQHYFVGDSRNFVGDFRNFVGDFRNFVGDFSKNVGDSLQNVGVFSVYLATLRSVCATKMAICGQILRPLLTFGNRCPLAR